MMIVKFPQTKPARRSVMHIAKRRGAGCPAGRPVTHGLPTRYTGAPPGGQATLLSLMELVIFCSVFSRVASLFSRAVTRWQACITVV